MMRFDYWDIDRLADQMIGVATLESLRGELKANVAQEYNRLSWGDVAQKILHTYHKSTVSVT
jgi:hypothetical protein